MRWKITAVLGVVALVSAVLAPRLLAPSQARIVTPEPTIDAHAHVAPPPLAIPEVRPVSRPGSIPEVVDPPPIPDVAPVGAVTPPHPAWDDCPGCGMG